MVSCEARGAAKALLKEEDNSKLPYAGVNQVRFKGFFSANPCCCGRSTPSSAMVLIYDQTGKTPN